jgi:hypothetical protein
VRRGAGALLAAVAACGGGAPPGEPAAPPAPPAPADSLVLRTADGSEIWFTDARPARDSAGIECLERSVEIRRDSVRIRVPLLYTRAAPTPLDGGHVRAELSLNCRTTAVYRVELATGRPFRMDAR